MGFGGSRVALGAPRRARPFDLGVLTPTLCSPIPGAGFRTETVPLGSGGVVTGLRGGLRGGDQGREVKGCARPGPAPQHLRDRLQIPNPAWKKPDHSERDNQHHGQDSGLLGRPRGERGVCGGSWVGSGTSARRGRRARALPCEWSCSGLAGPSPTRPVHLSGACTWAPVGWECLCAGGGVHVAEGIPRSSVDP